MDAQDFYDAAQEAEDIGAHLEYMEHYETLCCDDSIDSAVSQFFQKPV